MRRPGWGNFVKLAPGDVHIKVCVVWSFEAFLILFTYLFFCLMASLIGSVGAMSYFHTSSLHPLSPLSPPNRQLNHPSSACGFS